MKALLVFLVIIVIPEDGDDRQHNFRQLFDNDLNLSDSAPIGEIAAEDQDIGLRIDIG